MIKTIILVILAVLCDVWLTAWVLSTMHSSDWRHLPVVATGVAPVIGLMVWLVHGMPADE